MTDLERDLRLADGDRVYEALVDALPDHDSDQARRFVSALVLLLANQLGDDEKVLAAIRAAKAATDPG